ncbi:MAG: single-strand DNA-binding protein [Verrucomicrobiales bacterium]|jgi:single-strand DNA-binding protein
MASLNKVMLIGNLTRDPEIRYTPKGTAVTDLGLAINRTYSIDGGERREEVTFVDVTVWGKQAESAGQWLAKGRPVFIEGRLQMDEWDDKTSGQKRYRLKVVADGWQFVGPKSEGGPGGGSGGGGGQQQQHAPPQQQQQSGGNQGDQGQSSQPQQSQQSSPPQQQQQQGPPPGGSAPAAVQEEDDDIPF